MPCVNDRGQEFQAQDKFTLATKAALPGTRVLEYRITSAVPYAGVVYDKMLSDPSYFVLWHHAPTANGSICQQGPEHGTEGQGCSYPIAAAAYDWTQAAVREWWLDNVIKPTMVVADGAWIDGDGPDNGAWMCSGR